MMQLCHNPCETVPLDIEGIGAKLCVFMPDVLHLLAADC